MKILKYQKYKTAKQKSIVGHFNRRARYQFQFQVTHDGATS